MLGACVLSCGTAGLHCCPPWGWTRCGCSGCRGYDLGTVVQQTDGGVGWQCRVLQAKLHRGGFPTPKA